MTPKLKRGAKKGNTNAAKGRESEPINSASYAAVALRGHLATVLPLKTHHKRHQKTIKEGEVMTLEFPQQQVSYPESRTIFFSHPHSYSCFSKPEAS